MANNKVSIYNLLPEFEKFWQKRKKNINTSFKSEGNVWVITADYCLGDKDKQNNSIVFSMYPGSFVEDIRQNICMKKDIKNIKKVNSNTINFFRNYPFIYSIGFIFNDLNFLDDREVVNQWCETFNILKPVIKDRKKIAKFNKFIEYCKRKKIAVELMKNMYIVSLIFSALTEFLVIKENAQFVEICSDRDDLFTSKDCIILDLIYICSSKLVNGRKEFKLKFDMEHKSEDLKLKSTTKNKSKDFEFDKYIRVPDYITGTIASYNIETKEIEKRFKEIFEALCNNDKFVLYNLESKEEGIYCEKISLNI